MKKSQKIDYELVIQNAMRHAIYQLLKKIQKDGLPGNHYFYIDFLTPFSGVVLSDRLKEEYPEDMMISLQYDYYDLYVDENSFSVTLVFDEDEERITVPFAAITRFTDPSVDFGIEFTPDLERMSSQEIEDILVQTSEAPKEETKRDSGSNIISFETLKRK